MHAINPHVIRHARNRTSTDRRVVQEIARKVQSLQIPKRNTSERLRRKPKRRAIDKQADAGTSQKHAYQPRIRIRKLRPITAADRQLDTPDQKRRAQSESHKLENQPSGRKQVHIIDWRVSHLVVQAR